MLNVDVLTQEEMEAIDKHQVQQQLEWKRIPREGQLVSFIGTELLVLPGVFPPKADTVLLAEHLPTSGAVTVLDVGTGTGALAIWAAQHGATSVIAVDIAEAAVRNASETSNVLDLRVALRFEQAMYFRALLRRSRLTSFSQIFPVGTKQPLTTPLLLNGIQIFKHIEHCLKGPEPAFGLTVSSIW